MPLRSLLAVMAVCFCALPATSQLVPETLRATPEARERIGPLMAAMQMPELMQVMRQEGVAYSGDLEGEMFAGRGGAQWQQMVEQIYDPARMESLVRDELAADLDPWHIDPLLDFFSSDRGREIVELEIGARRAMLDPDVEAASADILEGMRLSGAERLDLLEEFARVNDLVEMNVVGALNANYAFYTGLGAAGALDEYLGEDEMLRDVWSQEPAIREQTDTWLFSYLALAYQPLDDADLEAYIAISETEAGQRLNVHLFQAFDEMFRTISYDLGMAAARFMVGEDL